MNKMNKLRAQHTPLVAPERVGVAAVLERGPPLRQEVAEVGQARWIVARTGAALGPKNNSRHVSIK